MKLNDGQRSFLAGLEGYFEKARKGYTSGANHGVLKRAAEIYNELTGETTNLKCGSCVISMLIRLERIITDK